MKDEKLTKELNELQRLKEIVIKSLKQAPEGRLRSEMAQGKYPQYYLINDMYKKTYPKGKYLKKGELDIAKRLAQKEYDQYVLDEIGKREKDIKNRLTLFENNNGIHKAYERLSCAKKHLVTPYVLPDEEYVNEWKKSLTNGSTSYPLTNGSNPYPVTNGFITENGELVRSKSEKIIADKLFIHNVPYKYEAGIVLNNKTIYPDFTILIVKTRETVYFEHFGMMDNPDYCKSAIERMELYESNGIHLGERLFVSFESSLKPISVSWIDMLIEKSF